MVSGDDSRDFECRPNTKQQPGVRFETGDTLMEDSTEYRIHGDAPRPVKPLDDPDFIGAEAALRRGSAKAVARDRAAGLEPVVRKPRGGGTEALMARGWGRSAG
jgi:hypothetical protein